MFQYITLRQNTHNDIIILEWSVLWGVSTVGPDAQQTATQREQD